VKEVFENWMKNWKQFTFVAILVIFSIFIGFTACGNNGGNNDFNDFTVTFELEGGNINGDTAFVTITVKSGETIKNLPNPQKANNFFGGWFTEKNGLGNIFTEMSMITENLTVYAKWGPPINVLGSTLTEKLQWLSSNAMSNCSYIIEVTSNEFLVPQRLSYIGRSNINIKLIGIGSEKIIDLYGKGSLFDIQNEVTLILDENITLRGISNNNASLVKVNQGGNLILNSRTKIINNISGGGINVDRGYFIMNGGEISGNSSSFGGGVYINNSTFIMNEGEISGNFKDTSTSTSDASGGGVYVSNGTFIMNNGKISGNSVNFSNSTTGGGVYVSGTFTLNDGEISGNSLRGYYTSNGGGVFISNGTFTMNGGKILGNTSAMYSGGIYNASNGGGVYVSPTGTFIMNGGEISGNSSSNGGGVGVGAGIFIMNNGEISSNSSSSRYSSSLGTSSYGGGVYVINGVFTMIGGKILANSSSAITSRGGGVYIYFTWRNIKFEKTGGIITGYSSDQTNGNMVVNGSGSIQIGYGDAVYVAHSDSRFIRRKESSSELLDTLVFITNDPNPPTISGLWDN